MSLVAVLAALSSLVASAQAPAPRVVEAEGLRAGAGARVVAAPGGRALELTGAGRARAVVRVADPSALRVVVRGRACGAAARVRVEVDGRRVLGAAAPRGWRSLAVPGALPPGRRVLAVALANPGGSAGCRRALRVDRIELRARGVDPPRWIPPPTLTWQWQLSGPLDLSVAADAYDIDLFDHGADVVDRLHAQGRRVICYTSLGTLEQGRDDVAGLPAAVVGRRLADWPQERWLDVRRVEVLRPWIERRLDLCRAKGFDAVEADNVDAYANRSGFPLTAADQLRFNRFLAKAAHERGLAIALKNDLDQVAALEPDFDFAVVEQCFQYDECDRLAPFTAAGKPVLVAEYGLPTSRFCAQARAAGLMAMRKRLDLDAWRQPCW